MPIPFSETKEIKTTVCATFIRPQMEETFPQERSKRGLGEFKTAEGDHTDQTTTPVIASFMTLKVKHRF